MHLQLARHASVCLEGSASLALAPRDAALLAWLALEGPTRRGRLAALLWPESDVEAARNALRQRLFQLRRQCGGVDLVAGGTTMALAPGLSHDLADSDHVLGDAVHEHSAEFAGWLREQRDRRHARLRQSLAARADAAERARDPAEALPHARELLVLEPLSEAAHCRLMRLHWLAGDRAAALLAFDRCEQVLKDEVGTRPSAETLALLAAIDGPQAPAPPAVATSPALLRPPRLVGRNRELQAALAAWQQGQVVALTGEAGLGKTRLLQELAMHRPGAVIAQARPGDSVVPYAAFGRMLRAVVARAPTCLQASTAVALGRLLPEAAAAPDRGPFIAPGHRLGLQRSVTALLCAAAAEGIDALLFDDLHFADEASLELLSAVLRPGDDAPRPSLRFALAQRPAEGSEALASLHDALAEDQALASITLGLLDEAQLRELVDSLALEGVDAAALTRQLYQRTGGNPLFALETLRHGEVESRGPGDALARPSSVARLIERRLLRLSAAAVRLARCAAAAGQDFDAALAAHVLGVPTLDLADAWAELDAAHVLRDGAFAHDLIHDAVLASVPAPVAQPLHAEIAAWLAGHGGAAGRIAQHWAKARRWTPAGQAYLAAAQNAQQAGRRIEEAALLGEAADCFERAGDATARFEALLQRADVLGHVELGAEAMAGVALAQAAAGNDEQRLRALLVRIQAIELRGQCAECLVLAPQGIADARALGRTDLVLGFALPLSGALAESRRGAEALAVLEPLRAWVDAEAGAEQRFEYELAIGIALDYANRLADAVPAWQAALAVAQRAGRNDLAWQALGNLASTQAKMGRVSAAVELGFRARQLADSSDDEARGRAMLSQVTLAHRLRDVGRYAEALPLLEDALVFFRRDGSAPYWRASAEHRLAQTYQQLGQPSRGKPLLASDLEGIDSAPIRLMRLLHRAELAREIGGDPVALVRAALALAPDRRDIYHRLATLFASAVLPADEGESLATGLAAWASVHQRHGLALAGHVRAAGCALAQGAARRAVPHVEAALHLAQAHEPDSFYLPELWLVAGRVLVAIDDLEAARTALAEGQAWLTRVHLEHVPAAFRNSFLHRNPVNRALLALAAKHA